MKSSRRIEDEGDFVQLLRLRSEFNRHNGISIAGTNHELGRQLLDKVVAVFTAAGDAALEREERCIPQHMSDPRFDLVEACADLELIALQIATNDDALYDFLALDDEELSDRGWPLLAKVTQRQKAGETR